MLSPATWAQEINLPKETIFMNLNRTGFIPGETLQVSLSLKSTNNTFLVSSVAYVQLVNDEGITILKDKALLVNGFGQTEFYLPSTLETGVYTVISFTKWMLNEGQVVKQLINVINPFSTLPKTLFESAHSLDSVRFKYEPEGGYFRKGKQTVYYQFTDEKDQLVNCSLLINGNQGVQLDIKNKVGFGSFELDVATPEALTVIITDEYENVHFRKLEVDSLHPSVLDFNETDQFIRLTNINKDIVNEVQIILQGEVVLSMPPTSSQLDFSKSSLPKSLLLLQALDKNENIIYQHKYFNKPLKQKLSAAISNMKLTPRENFELTIQSEVQMNVDLVIRRKQPIDRIENAVSNYFLGNTESKLSEIWPESDVPIYPFSINHDPTIYSNNLPDYRGELISGRLLTINGELVPNKSIQVTALGDQYSFLRIRSDNQGLFKFSIPDISEGNLLTFSDLGEMVVQLESPFISTESLAQSEFVFLSDSLSESWLKNKSAEVQIMNIYSNSLTVTTQGRNSKELEGVFQQRDIQVYRLDDFTRFSTVEEHIIEYINQVSIRGKSGERKLIIHNQSALEKSHDVMVTLNGIIAPTEHLLGYNPIHLERIEVCLNSFRLGDKTYSGAVNFVTFPENESSVENVPGTQVITFRWPSNHLSSKSMAIDDRTPDMRTQIAFEASLATSKTPIVKTFACPDIQGIYEVVIQGVDNDSFIYEILEFEVIGN